MLPLLWLTACDTPDLDAHPVDVAPLPASRALPGRPDWLLQLQGSPAFDADIQLVELDLFDTPDADLAAWRASGAVVVCYFSAGSWEDWRPDADAFPRSLLGRRLDGWPGERWLDVSSPDIDPLLEARLDLAVQRGCDAVDPDNVNGHQNPTGFDLQPDEQLGFDRWLYSAARARGLAVLLKNTQDLLPDLADWVDGAVVEECAAWGECAPLAALRADDKPVLAIEYANDESPAGVAAHAEAVCPALAEVDLSGQVLPLALDGSFRHVCP